MQDFGKGGGGPSYVYTQGGGGSVGPAVGPMLRSLYRGPKRGGGGKDPPGPHLTSHWKKWKIRALECFIILPSFVRPVIGLVWELGI